MTEQRKKLIDRFQRWLDTNPNKRIVASQCANIAEDYAKEVEEHAKEQLYKMTIEELIKLKIKESERELKRLKSLLSTK